ncbi:hypothetical protein HDV01_001181 [Terramyces sp. JEL0728]|nr:hypothetical protein HDV01_001181 [Terramyces sp. JEL0728]
MALPNNCVPVSLQSACAPWTNGAFIDTNVLNQVYFGPKANVSFVTATSWNQLILDNSAGSFNLRTGWSDFLGCTGYRGELIQYYRTFLCLTDIFYYSAACNTPPTNDTLKYPPLCSSSCDTYGDSLKQVVLGECTNFLTTNITQQQQTAFDNHKKVVQNAADQCKSLFTSGTYFKGQDVCQSGIALDNSTCGFGGDTGSKENYCLKNPNVTCCSVPSPQLSPFANSNFSLPLIVGLLFTGAAAAFFLLVNVVIFPVAFGIAMGVKHGKRMYYAVPSE